MEITQETLRRLRHFFLVFISLALIHQLIRISHITSDDKHHRFKAGRNTVRQQPDKLITHQGENTSGDLSRKSPTKGNRHVMFNALPKTGSRTLNTVALNVAVKQGIRVENTMALENETIPDKIDRLLRSSRPTFIYSHQPFYDIEVPHKPVFVSLIRDPIDRLVSLYYFKVYGDSTDRSRFRDEMDKMNYTKEPFDACYRKRGICVSNGVFVRNIQHFCGIAPGNSFPSARTCLKRSKENIRDKYLVVGVMEDYDGFLKVLEKLLPNMFKGATTFYHFWKRMSYLNATTTLHKISPSESVRKALRSELKMEYELYDFVKEEFEKLKSKLEITS